MATTENLYTGNGSTVLYSFTFPYLNTSDVKVTLDGTDTTAYTLANATQVQFTTAPASGVAIRIFRRTTSDQLSTLFFSGASIRAEDLNVNLLQNLYVSQETEYFVDAANSTADAAKTAADAAVVTANSAAADATSAVATSNTANTNATAAQASAATAASDAAAAAASASSSASQATAAQNSATAAQTSATAAETSATAAQNSASAAQTSASNAESSATTAANTASTALTTAQNADANASAAVSTANTASTNASNAVTTANTASTTASSAVSTANAADTNASSAVSTANAASVNASNAVTTANAAQASAATAVSDASTAVSDAASAVTTANTANTNASAAVTTANNADTNATAAVATANTANTNATAAQTAATNAATDASNAATDASNAASSASSAQASATAAQTSATSAQTSATAAQTSAANAATSLASFNSSLAGKADLVNGVLDTTQIPDLAISEFKGSVSSQSAMLAISGEKGDWVTRSDDGKVYVITGTDPSVIGGWTALTYPVASAANLSYTSSTRLIGISGGTGATLPEVTAAGDSGLMTGADKTKLDGIASGAEVNAVTSVNGQTGAVTVSGSTDLSYTASTRELASSTGTNATLPEVVAAGDSGLMTGADKTKLDGIASGATNVTNNNQLTNGAGYLPQITTTYNGTYNIPIITGGNLYPNPSGGGVTITGSSGSLTASGNVTAYSDINLKENIEVIPNALTKLSEIRGVTYDRKDLVGRRQAGVIAQEVEAVLPEVVMTNEEGIKSVAYGNLVGLLIEAVKELKAEVETLKQERD